MKRNVVLILLALLVVCFSATAVGKGGNPHPRPFKGQMSGEAGFDFTSGACLDVTGAPWQTVAHATGQLSHFGRSAWYGSHCTTPDGGYFVDGEATIVAANGDELWVTYTGDLIGDFVLPPAVYVYVQENIVVGGTGRFEGASGEFLMLVTVTVEDLTVPTTPVDIEVVEGSVRY